MRALAFALLLGACATPPSTELYAHPWPDERLRREDGTASAATFPEGNGAPLRQACVESLRGVDGFGTTSGIFFPFDAPLDPRSLPDVAASGTAAASVFVIDVDDASPERGRRALIDARFLADGGSFGGTNLLVALPYPGLPLRPDTLYAAVVTTAVRDATGGSLEARPLDTPTEAHRAADRALTAMGVTADLVVQRAVFRTGDPTRGLRDALAQASREEHPAIAPLRMVEEQAGYCVLRGWIDMPVYQRGEPPYTNGGGGWAYDDAGTLLRQRHARSRVFVTVPRVERELYPSAVFVRAGGGGDRPLVDRGPRDEHGRSPPGSGLARELAEAGYVGLTVDGPLGGARNLAGWDEQTAIFDVLAPLALRDNVRQSALELALFAQALDGLTVDASECAGAAETVRVDPRPVLIGHSTGATIAPLAAAIEPRFRALVMSGAGGSWIRQVMYKRSPMEMRPLAELLLEYWPHRALVEHDPFLSLLQWAGEAADPIVYGRALGDRPVLVFQGLVDTYILPPIANPVALSLDLELGGAALDEGLG
ncbi:MAG: hypothetical protein R3B82_02515 [Sandaracinaceae bacterium]